MIHNKAVCRPVCSEAIIPSLELEALGCRYCFLLCTRGIPMEVCSPTNWGTLASSLKRHYRSIRWLQKANSLSAICFHNFSFPLPSLGLFLETTCLGSVCLYPLFFNLIITCHFFGCFFFFFPSITWSRGQERITLTVRVCRAEFGSSYLFISYTAQSPLIL